MWIWGKKVHQKSAVLSMAGSNEFKHLMALSDSYLNSS